VKTGVIANSTLCIPLLYFLKTQGWDLCVYSAENGTGISSFCDSENISCTYENNNPQCIYEWVAAQQPHVVFVVGYNSKIKTARFGNHPSELFNVHFGHLPEYRGPNPVFWQLKKGVRTLAISIHRISERLDAGAIVWKKEFLNEPFFSYGYVHQLMSHNLVEGVNYLLQIKKLNQPIPGTEQNEQHAAYFHRPAAKDVCVQWQTMQAAEICDLVKACNPWNSGAITIYNGFEVRISDAEQIQHGTYQLPDSVTAGTIIDTDKRLLVSCINNEIIHIHTLTVNGVLVPGRFATPYGFVKGHLFTSL